MGSHGGDFFFFIVQLFRLRSTSSRACRQEQRSRQAIFEPCVHDDAVLRALGRREMFTMRSHRETSPSTSWVLQAPKRKILWQVVQGRGISLVARTFVYSLLARRLVFRFIRMCAGK